MPTKPSGGSGIDAAPPVRDAFLAAGDAQQIAVERRIPVPRQAFVGEGPVEGRQVAVALGFGERAVHVPDQRLERHAAR